MKLKKGKYYYISVHNKDTMNTDPQRYEVQKVRLIGIKNENARRHLFANEDMATMEIYPADFKRFVFTTRKEAEERARLDNLEHVDKWRGKMENRASNLSDDIAILEDKVADLENKPFPWLFYTVCMMLGSLIGNLIAATL